MLDIRTLISTVAIAFMLILAAGSVARTTDAAAGFATNTDIVLDECFDVSISELADCRRENQRLAQSYRHRLDECFDVPLRERTACRQTTTALSR